MVFPTIIYYVILGANIILVFSQCSIISRRGRSIGLIGNKSGSHRFVILRSRCCDIFRIRFSFFHSRYPDFDFSPRSREMAIRCVRFLTIAILSLRFSRSRFSPPSPLRHRINTIGLTGRLGGASN